MKGCCQIGNYQRKKNQNFQANFHNKDPGIMNVASKSISGASNAFRANMHVIDVDNFGQRRTSVFRGEVVNMDDAEIKNHECGFEVDVCNLDLRYTRGGLHLFGRKCVLNSFERSLTHIKNNKLS